MVTQPDAAAQIESAQRFLNRKVAGRAAPLFAFPFGHCNDFLTGEYLPAHGNAVGLRAAFTTEPKPMSTQDDRWSLPRWVCGHHWKSPDDLRALLTT